MLTLPLQGLYRPGRVKQRKKTDGKVKDITTTTLLLPYYDYRTHYPRKSMEKMAMYMFTKIKRRRLHAHSLIEIDYCEGGRQPYPAALKRITTSRVTLQVSHSVVL